jgi:hypothetical protein
MERLHPLEIIIMLFAAVLALTTVARKVLVPYPARSGLVAQDITSREEGSK